MAKGYLHILTGRVKGDVFVNGEYRGTGDINIELEQGTYSVTFGNVAGYVAPSPMSIRVDPGFTALVNVEYTK